ncbi:protein MIZU-KUSSEI 1-like [Henckelia pumila]|uniref:protein MIZU-KUSSEI 1-like n=1 Tax=Henckelia pumila TaxID=405737 RepID=UPI003C6DF7D4
MSTITQYEQRFLTLPTTKSTVKIIPPTHLLESASDDDYHRHFRRSSASITTFFKSLFSIISFPSSILPSCRWLSLPIQYHSVTPALGRKVTGTLFGNRRGNVSFAVQADLTSEPFLLLELGVSTSALVKKMSSGVVRIALECEKTHGLPPQKRRTLVAEPVWTMYCNGRNCGYAASRVCGQSDWHVLSKVRSVSVGAGVIPVVEDGLKSGGASEGELLYMRARFERVVGTRDSEAFYMLNPDGNGGPELSIFLLRI